MEIIKPKVEIIMEPDNLKRIEIAGRTCYKSESQITDDSAQVFYQNLIHRGHTSVLEHSNIILESHNEAAAGYLVEMVVEGKFNSDVPDYIRMTTSSDFPHATFSANIRAWRTFIQHHLSISKPEHRAAIRFYFSNVREFDDLFQHFSVYEAEIYRELYANPIVTPLDVITSCDNAVHNIITARFTCSRAMSHELVRHRLMGISQESQRYVKYGELTVIEPYWWENLEYPKYEVARTVFLKSNLEAEHNYSAYIDAGLPPQAARGALTNDTKTEVVLTGTIPAWERFLSLRDSAAAHPDIQILAHMFREKVNEIPELQVWGL